MKRLPAILLQITGALALLALVVGGGLALSAGLWLRMDEEPRPAAAIVILAGDIRRALYAADLYHQGLAPVVYISRPHHDPPEEMVALGWNYPLQEDDMRLVLARKGVPDEAVRLYGHDLLSTVQESEALAGELAASGLPSGPLLVVTSPYHCRRAGLILSRIVRDREIIMSATPYERLDVKWWTQQDSARAVIVELAKFVFYAVGTPFRSAPAATTAAAN